MFKSPFRIIDEEHMHKFLAHEAEVLKFAQLKDTDKLLHLETAITRLSVQTIMYSQSLSKQNYNKIFE